MAKSLILAGSIAATLSNLNAVTYWSCIGYVDKAANATDKEMIINQTGTLSKLSIKIITSSLTGGATYTILKNGSPTALTCSTSAANETGTIEDTAHSVAVAPGDKIILKEDPGASTGQNRVGYIQMLFTPDDNSKTYSFFGAAHGSTRSVSSASTTWFYPITTYLDTLNTTEASHQIEMRVSGTFKNLSVNVLTNARTTNTVFKLRKNGADTGLTVTFGNLEYGRKTDSSNTVSVVAGDKIDLAITTSTGTQTLALATWNLEFENTDSPGVHLIMASNFALGTQSRNQTLYCGVSGYFDLLASETDPKLKMIDNGFTARNLGCRISQNSNSSTSRLILRVNTADSALSVSITAATADWFEDTSNSVVLNDNDEIAGKFLIGAGSGSQTITIKNWTLYLDASNVAAVVASEVSSLNLANKFLIKV